MPGNPVHSIIQQARHPGIRRQLLVQPAGQGALPAISSLRASCHM